MSLSWINRRKTIKDLLKAFDEVDYPRSYSWIKRQEAKGNLIMPKSTTDYRKPRGDRKIGFLTELTDDQINNIVKAFLPGGVGYWSYKA